MKRLVGLESLGAPAEGTAVTVGTFDGVHIGHRSLIARTVQRARDLSALAAAITWDRHPNATLRPERVPPLLTSQERKMELLEGTDLDVLVVLAFDTALARWPPERFAIEVVSEGLGAKAVVVGEGWRFGRRATGDIPLLKRLGGELGFDVEALPLAEVAGVAASSSRVREAVAHGEMELARALLGRPFDLDGVVVRGDDRGARLGYPTANLAPDPALVLPPRGVYAGRGRVDESWHKAAISLGVNPTFGGEPATSPLRLEAYLLDFEGDLYGRTVRIEFWKRLRDELAFPSVDGLLAQIAADVRLVDELVEG